MFLQSAQINKNFSPFTFVFLFFTASFFSFNVFGNDITNINSNDDQTEIKTFFGSGLEHSGGYGCPEFKFFPGSDNALSF